MMDKKQLSEQEIRTRYVTPAIEKAGWDIAAQVREEFKLTDGRIIVRGKLHVRARHKRADYALFYKPGVPLAIAEAKKNSLPLGDGNKGLSEAQTALVTQDYYSGGSGKTPRYYQLLAINKTTEAIARHQNRILLVMATGTGKTFTAFQIIWRLWKAKAKKRILFLADRNILIDQTMTNDFKPFGKAMTKIKQRQADKSYEIYLSLYQAVTGLEEEKAYTPPHFSTSQSLSDNPSTR